MGPDGLDVMVCATNVGNRAASHGVGQHPYPTLGAGTVDTALLTVSAREHIHTGHRGLPAGQEPFGVTDFGFRAARPIGSRQPDTAFALGRSDGDVAVVRLAQHLGARGVAVRLGGRAPVTYGSMGDTLPGAERRRGIAVEPMPCPPDSFRSGLGVHVRGKGDTHVLRWGLTARRPT
ncbi:hypothetical protein [Streptomyces sp. NPDC048332]|uniref:aldose epimerase family protein n=1 Tax=Streptomyces sp. NPDC048332 TaxID=3154619 RepID=UPI003419DDC6